MTNLLRETLQDMARWGLDIGDVVYIGDGEPHGFACTWAEFKTLADIDYDSGFGSQEVAPDLVIGFRDGSLMCRSEYDGSEAWTVFHPFRTPPGPWLPIKRLVTTHLRRAEGLT
jgi:hypothetical protein